MMFLLAMLGVFNPADYGARGDAFIGACSTTASDPIIAVDGQSFTVADVGKLALVFGVGTITTGTNRQDLVATITGASGGDLTLDTAPTLTASNVRVIVGTQNVNAFQSVINACASTSDTITNAPGTYLLVSPALVSGSAASNSFALSLNRGGIHFVGQSATNTTLLSCGAWRLIGGAATRGFMFAVGSVTNDYPVILENLTLDGGVAQGNTTSHGFPASAVTGEGWDETHNAWKESGTPQHSYKAFRNCVFRGWRGEVLIDNSAWTNSVNEVTSCIFYDCNASALNLTGAYQVRGTVTTNTYLSMEWYMGYANTNSLMETSDFGANVVLLGALAGHTQPPFLARSNTFRGYIQCSPAVNITILNNTFLEPTVGIFVTSAGYQGTDHNHDWLIASNLFQGVYNPVALDGGVNNRTEAVTISHNTVTGAGFPLLYGFGQNSNIIVSANIGNSATMNCAAFTGQWALDDGSNVCASKLDSWDVVPKAISYAYGISHRLDTFATNIWTLDDAGPSMIPAGARLAITANSTPRVWSSSVNYPNCYSRLIPSGGVLNFAWTGTSWQPTDRIDAAAVTVGTLRGQ